jgi:hypothetical protein
MRKLKSEIKYSTYQNGSSSSSSDAHIMVVIEPHALHWWRTLIHASSFLFSKRIHNLTPSPIALETWSYSLLKDGKLKIDFVRHNFCYVCFLLSAILLQNYCNN